MLSDYNRFALIKILKQRQSTTDTCSETAVRDAESSSVVQTLTSPELDQSSLRVSSRQKSVSMSLS